MILPDIRKCSNSDQNLSIDIHVFGGACLKLVIVIVTIKYSIVTTFKEYVVINTVTTFSSCKSIISTHSCCNRADKL